VAIAVTLTCVADQPVAASAPGLREKTVITSDSLEFDYGRSIAHFLGNVVVVDPRVTIHCEELQVEFAEDNSVDTVVAKRNVRIEQEDKLGTCDQAVYTAAAGSIVMTGKARLKRGRDIVLSKEIKIFVNSEKIQSDKRSKLVIFPESAQRVRKGGETKKRSP